MKPDHHPCSRHCNTRSKGTHAPDNAGTHSMTPSKTCEDSGGREKEGTHSQSVTRRSLRDRSGKKHSSPSQLELIMHNHRGLPRPRAVLSTDSRQQGSHSKHNSIQHSTSSLNTAGPSDDAHGLSSSTGRGHVLRHLNSLLESSTWSGKKGSQDQTRNNFKDHRRSRAHPLARQTVDPDFDSSPGTSASHA